MKTPYSFREWSTTLIEQAKRRGVKVTRKNIERLRAAHWRLAMADHGAGFDTMLKVYFDPELFKEEFLKRDWLMSSVPKSDCWVGGFFPIPLVF